VRSPTDHRKETNDLLGILVFLLMLISAIAAIKGLPEINVLFFFMAIMGIIVLAFRSEPL
jgi:hypothetical protein